MPKTYETLPAVKTALSPREALGADYNKFCEIYKKYRLAKIAARNADRKFEPNFSSDDDQLLWRRCLANLEQRGYAALDVDDNGYPVFYQRRLPAYTDRQDGRPTDDRPITEEERQYGLKYIEKIKKTLTKTI